MDKNKTPGSGRGWTIVIFFTLFMAVMTYNLIVFPACAIDAMSVFGIGQAELTTLSSVTSVVGVFAGIVFGRILDTKNVKKSIVIFMAVGVVLFFARAFITSYVPVMVLTFLASFSVGICQVAGPKVVATWFPANKVGTAMSFLTAGAGIGSAGGFALGAVLGIQNALLSVGIAYLVLLVFWIIAGGEGSYKVAAPAAAHPSQGSSSRVYKSKNLWMIILAYSMAVTSSLLVNTYMINAFVGKGLNPEQAAVMATCLNLALMLGGFIMTAILGMVKRFNILLAVSMLGSAVLVLAGWFLPIGAITWVCVILGGLFFGGSLGLCVGRVPLLPLTADFGPEHIGTASGFTETVKGIISFILPIVVASALGTNFNGIFIVFAVCCILCVLFGSLLVPELGEKGRLFQRDKQRDELSPRSIRIPTE